jgi:hypothetical protein
VRGCVTDFTLFLLDLSLVIAVFLMLVVSAGASTMAGGGRRIEIREHRSDEMRA